jgi:hypothetical protein
MQFIYTALDSQFFAFLSARRYYVKQVKAKQSSIQTLCLQ